MSTTILSSISIDDRHGNVTYVPDRWTVHTNVESIYHLWNNTDTFSDIQNATATVKFYGNAIEYWGNQGPYHGPCIMSVDGQEMTTINSHATADGYPIMLFSKSDLSLGDHELQVRVVNPSYPNVCEVDRFVVNVTSATGGNTGNSGGGDSGGGSTNNAGVPTRRKSNPPIGIIAGAAGAALGLLILFLLWMWLRKKSKRRAATREKISKPMFVDDDPAYRSPPSFAQGMNYTSLLSPSQAESLVSPSSANTSMYLPAGATISTYNPYAAQHNVHDTPSALSHPSAPLTTTASGSFNSGRNEYDQPIAHVRNLDHLIPDDSRSSSTMYNALSMPAASQHQPSVSYLAKEREAFANSGPSASGSGSSSGGQYGRAVVMSPEVEPELPPPAYEG